MRGVNDDEAVPLLRWCLGDGLPAAVHRADAAGRPARLGPDDDGDGRRDPRPAGGVVHARAGRRRGARQRARGGVAGRRRARPGRRHRLGDPAVLRRLRPGPADRRRSDPQLPVRPRGDRPARRDAGRRLRRRPRRPDARPRCSRRWPGTASTTPASCSRPARCPRSAAEAWSAGSAGRVAGHSPYGTVCFRKPRVSRKPLRFSRCVSHAVQVLRRSGACSLGLFHASTQVAVSRQPLAEQTGEVDSFVKGGPSVDGEGGDAGQPRGEPPGIALTAPAPGQAEDGP